MSRSLKRVLLYSLIGAVALGLVSAVTGFILGYQDGRGTPVDLERALFVMAIVGIAAMIGSMATTVAWMRSIDEAAREAHKSAWFWGGCAGLSVGGVFFVLASIPPSAAIEIPSSFPGRTDPVAYAATGAAALALLMIAGYTLAWAWWWWRRR